MIEYNYFIADSLIIFYFSNTILTFSFKTVKMKVIFFKGEPPMEPGSVLSRQQYEEKISHTTADLPFALHRLSYPAGADILFYQHWHREFEFIMVTGGCLELTVESRTHILQSGEGAFINASFSHSGRSACSQSCSFTALDFSYELLDENPHSHFSRKYINPVLEGYLLFPEAIHLSGNTLLLCKAASWQSKLLFTLREIESCPDDILSKRELFLKSRIYLLWELLFQQAQPDGSGNRQERHNRERLSPVLSYIREHFSEEISLAQLASIAALSEGRFCRIFRETMNQTPFQYIMHYRVMQSCSLLTETDLPIGEIALRSGFNNISYYNKTFLKQIGCTPRHYRTYTVFGTSG